MRTATMKGGSIKIFIGKEYQSFPTAASTILLDQNAVKQGSPRVYIRYGGC
jgi:hypothetical protein